MREEEQKVECAASDSSPRVSWQVAAARSIGVRGCWIRSRHVSAEPVINLAAKKTLRLLGACGFPPAPSTAQLVT